MEDMLSIFLCAWFCSAEFICSCNSVAHEYKEWKDEDTQLVTCSKNIIQSGTPPLEVDADKEVVFTYDVTFEVSSSEPFQTSLY